MQTSVKTWGNGQGIRIPKEVLQAAGIAVDEVLNITVHDGMIILEKPFRHKTLEERAAKYGGELNLNSDFEWGEPVGSEVW